MAQGYSNGKVCRNSIRKVASSRGRWFEHKAQIWKENLEGPTGHFFLTPKKCPAVSKPRQERAVGENGRVLAELLLGQKSTLLHYQCRYSPCWTKSSRSAIAR